VNTVEDGDPGLVTILKYTSPISQVIARIWAPNPIIEIIPTGVDRTVFLIDSYGWISQYDYDGNFKGVLRQAPRSPALFGGVAYGWDTQYKRLFMVEATPDTMVTGQRSTLLVKAFYPVSAPTYLSAAIPSTVPRKNRPTYYFANLCDDGGNGVASHLGISAGGIQSQLSDSRGDIPHLLEPNSAGVFDLGLTVYCSTFVTPPSDGLILPVGGGTVISVASTDGFSKISGTIVIDGQTITYSGGADQTNFYGCIGGNIKLYTGAVVTG
jgi:hypothetical protein